MKFLDDLRTLTLSSSHKSVRFILAGQNWEDGEGKYYKVHTISNLSSEAAIQLLGELQV